jgi:thiamine-monophosphate kinase
MKGYGLEVALGPGAEFDLVRRFAEEWGAKASALGDDAAVLPLVPGMQLMVSTDTSVEGVHFVRAWLTPYEIGWRAAAAALSDLAAMAAQPLGLLCAMTLPDDWLEDAQQIASGVGDAVASIGTRIVGGDLTSGGELSLCVTVLGSAARPLARSGALPGDAVYVTGRLGGTRAALAAWESRGVPAPDHRERFARPHPRIREAMWLESRGAHAAIDISDGLAADLQHIAAASGVAIELDLDRVPTARGVTPEEAAASGEEYEVLVTAGRPPDLAEFRTRFAVDLTEIGRVLGPAIGGELVTVRGGKRVDPPRGHDHFSS